MRELLKHLMICAVVVLVAGTASARQKETHCKWGGGVDGARVDVADAELYLADDARVGEALVEHIPFGLPRSDSDAGGERLLAQEHYVVWYDDDLRAPLWTAHFLPKSEADDSRTREDSFRSDPRLGESERSECADYKEPIFDQGHMVPRADMNRSEIAMDNTYFMSNMTPQHCAFNRGAWLVLEEAVRDWAKQEEKIWVITGAVYDRVSPPGRDGDDEAWRMEGKKGRRVAIPSAQYKIVVRLAQGGFETLSIMLPNNDMKVPKMYMGDYIGGHVTTLDAIARRSGFRFLQSAAATESPALWPLSGTWIAPLTALCDDEYPEK